MNKNTDMFVLGVCIILLFVFVYFLPKLNNNVQNSASNQEIIPEKIPVTYYCERDVDTQLNATIKQQATYTINDKDITYALIVRTYQFNTVEDYNNYKNNIIVEEKRGITIENQFDDKKMQVVETTKKDLNKISAEDLDANFPKTYDNLLIYTKGQDCIATY